MKIDRHRIVNCIYKKWSDQWLIEAMCFPLADPEVAIIFCSTSCRQEKHLFLEAANLEK
jgi:hypothetical protein